MSQLVIKDTAQQPHPSQPSMNDELPEAYVKARAKFKSKHKLPQPPEEIKMENNNSAEESNWEEIAPTIRREVAELEDTQFLYLYLRSVVNRSRKSQEVTIKSAAKDMLQSIIDRLEVEIAQRKTILARMPQG